METGQTIPIALLERPIEGIGLHQAKEERSTLGRQLDSERPTLLVFLRHFGCTFCREMVKDIRIAADRADALEESNADAAGRRRYPRVVFVHQGDLDHASDFFGKHWPGACAISDRQKVLYGEFGLSRGSMGQFCGPRPLACGVRALLKGHGIGRPVGDVFMMPGLFLVSPGGQILHRHHFEHAGHHPDFSRFADSPIPVPAARTAPAGAIL